MYHLWIAAFGCLWGLTQLTRLSRLSLRGATHLEGCRIEFCIVWHIRRDNLGIYNIYTQIHRYIYIYTVYIHILYDIYMCVIIIMRNCPHIMHIGLHVHALVHSQSGFRKSSNNGALRQVFLVTSSVLCLEVQKVRQRVWCLLVNVW